MTSKTYDGLSTCSIFPKCPSSYELESDKPVLPEIEHFRGKIGEREFETLKTVLNKNADVFQNIRRILVVVISSSTKSNKKKAPLPIGRVQDA